MKTSNQTIPGRSPPGLTMAAPSSLHQDGGVKHATGASSTIRGRDNVTISTWTTRILRTERKLQELTDEMDRYRWNILGLCEMRWKKLVLAITFGHHKESRRWTWHSPYGQHHNQIDYILVRKRFRSGVKIARTRSFPGADIGSDHGLLMIRKLDRTAV